MTGTIAPARTLRDRADAIDAVLPVLDAHAVHALHVCTGEYDDHIIAFSAFDQVPIFGPCANACTVRELA